MISTTLPCRCTLFIATCFVTSVAFGVQIEPNQYTELLKEANATGTVSVLVGLDVPPTLTQNRDLMEEKAKPLLAELGQNVLDVGYWNNGLGQVGFYVTAKGLQILADSTNAKSFMPDVTRKMRFRANNSDGSLDAIENTINTKGFADVEVFLNIDEGDYDFNREGKTTFWPSSGLSNQVMTQLSNISAQAFAKSFQNIDISPTQAGVPSPSFLVRLDKNAFYGLRESSDIRTIRPIGYVDPRPAQWPADALAEAKALGSVEASITLRSNPMSSSLMSDVARKAYDEAIQRAFDEILFNAGSSAASLKPYFGIDSISGFLSYNTLVRLYENADPRVLSINPNKPVDDGSGNTTPPTNAAQPTPFTKPAQYCFLQNEWRGSLSQQVFDHHLLVAEVDHYKNGDVFVAFNLKNSPDTLWLSNYAGKWSANSASTGPIAYYSGSLQPTMKIAIIPQPLDLTQLSGNGVLYVGYGLRNSATATTHDAFQEMVSSQRYYKVWEIGTPHQPSTTICLTTTQMTTDDLPSLKATVSPPQ